MQDNCIANAKEVMRKVLFTEATKLESCIEFAE